MGSWEWTKVLVLSLAVLICSAIHANRFSSSSIARTVPSGLAARFRSYGRLTLHPAVLLHANWATNLLQGFKTWPEPALPGYEARGFASICVTAAARHV